MLSFVVRCFLNFFCVTACCILMFMHIRLIRASIKFTYLLYLLLDLYPTCSFVTAGLYRLTLKLPF